MREHSLPRCTRDRCTDAHTLRTWRRSATVLTTFLLAACGNVTPGGYAPVNVAVSGDADGSAAAAPALEAGTQSPTPSPAPTPSSSSGSSGSGHGPDGEIEVEFDLYLVSQDGRVTQLNSDRVRVRVDVRGRDEASALRAVVEASQYTELRIVFSDIEVDIDSGLIIDGIPVVGEIRVEFDDVSLEVTRPLDLDLSAESRGELLLDLNTADWLQAVDPVTRLVAPAEFANLIAIVSR